MDRKHLSKNKSENNLQNMVHAFWKCYCKEYEEGKKRKRSEI